MLQGYFGVKIRSRGELLMTVRKISLISHTLPCSKILLYCKIHIQKYVVQLVRSDIASALQAAIRSELKLSLSD